MFGESVRVVAHKREQRIRPQSRKSEHEDRDTPERYECEHESLDDVLSHSVNRVIETIAPRLTGAASMPAPVGTVELSA